MLNAMADPVIERSLERQRSWGLEDLDLKDSIYGNGVLDLDAGQRDRLRLAIDGAGMSVHCLSTNLFHDRVERGEGHFRTHHSAKVAIALETASVLRPRFIRLLAAGIDRSSLGSDDAITAIDQRHGWLWDLYREAIARITDAGWEVTIENEVGGCILSSPEEFRSFFQRLGGKGPGLCATWDVQNLWQEGTFPSLATYHQIKDLIGYVHLKGGATRPGERALCWKSPLAEASWPVSEIVRAVIHDQVSPIICLNPSHGIPRPGRPMGDPVPGDIAHLRTLIDMEIPP